MKGNNLFSMDSFSTADYVSIFVDLSLKILREDKKMSWVTAYYQVVSN